jgi:transcriptional regulator with XRE-family HTH domain
MAKKTAPLLPSTEDLLGQFGARLRAARLRRRLAAKQVAERAGMTPMTLRSLERGGSGVTMGAYLAVMQVLGIEKDLDLLAKVDPVGRELQDARLPVRTTKSAPAPSGPVRESPDRPDAPIKKIEKPRKLPPKASHSQWMQKGGFSSAQELADLIDPPAPAPKRKR